MVAMRAVRLLAVVGVACVLGVFSESCSSPRHCASDLECRPGDVCNGYYEVCQTPACTSDKDCGRGNVCTVSYVCAEGCRSNDDCDPGTVCSASSNLFDNGPNQCVTGCRSDGDCADGEVCSDFFDEDSFVTRTRCVKGCRSNSDCPPGNFCPITQFVLNGVTSFAESAICTKGCHDDGECQSSSVCDEGACHPRCSAEAACENGMACVALHAAGSFRVDETGAPITCGDGERCRCWSSFTSEGGCNDTVQCRTGYLCIGTRCVKPNTGIATDAGLDGGDAGPDGSRSTDSGEAGP